MKKSLILFLLTMLQGQVDLEERLSYFPLQVGNLWQYYIDGSDGFEPYYFNYITIEVIGDTILPNNLSYFILKETKHYNWDEFHEFYYLKTDSLNAIVSSSDSCVYYDLGLEISDTLEFPTCNFSLHYIDSIGLGVIDSLDSYTNNFLVYHLKGYNSEKSVTFYKNLGIVYENYSDSTIHPGEGWVYAGYEMGIRGAIINGVQYGEILEIDDRFSIIPKQFSLFQNYPNPFNTVTIISFSIREIQNVNISILNILGQNIDILVDQQFVPGYYHIKWNAKNFPSGIYVIRMESDNYVQTKKAIFLK